LVSEDRFSVYSMDPAAVKFLLDEIDKKFDEADARFDRLFARLQQPTRGSTSSSCNVDNILNNSGTDCTKEFDTSEQIPAAQFDAEVVTDDWGELFKQPAHLLEERDFEFSAALPFAVAPASGAAFSFTDDVDPSTEPSFDPVVVRVKSDVVEQQIRSARDMPRESDLLFSDTTKQINPLYAAVDHSTNGGSDLTLSQVACRAIILDGTSMPPQAYESIITVFIIDSCGVRGIIPGTILGFLVEKLQEFAAKDINDFFLEHNPRILPPSSGGDLLGLFSTLLGPKHDDQYLHALVRELLDETRFIQALHNSINPNLVAMVTIVSTPSSTLIDAQVVFDEMQPRMNVNTGVARLNPQGSFQYGSINLSQVYKLGNEPHVIINGKKRSTLYFRPATPRSLGALYNKKNVFTLDFPTMPIDGPVIRTSVINSTYKNSLEIVFQNNDTSVQTYHVDGYAFWVVGMDYGEWTENSHGTYNKWDVVSRCTTRAFPGAWTAVTLSLDSPGFWNVRTEDLDTWYITKLTSASYMGVVLLGSSAIKFLYIMCGTQGALIVASALQIIVTFSGLWRNVARYPSSLSAAPLVALVVFGLYELEIPSVTKCVEIGLPGLILLLIFAMYLPHTVHMLKSIFDRIVVLFTIPIVWPYADLLTVGGAYRNVDNDLFDMFGSKFHQSSHNAGADLVSLVYIILRITPLLMSTQARAALDSPCLMCMPVDAAYELFEKLFKSHGGAILLIQLNIMQGPDSMLFEPWYSSSYDATIGLLIHWDPGRLALDLQRLHAWRYNLSMVCHLSFYPRAGKRKALSVDAVIVFGSQRISQVVHSVMRIMSILSRSIKCLQFSWDPGGSNVTHRLEGKPHFKKGGMLGTAGPIAHGTAQLSDGLCYK
jgi:hypothetical protein